MGPDNGPEREIFMTRSVARAAATAAAATLLVCTVVLASAFTADLAFTGLLHMPHWVTYAVGAAVCAGTAWLAFWFFRKAYAVERRAEPGGADSPPA